MTQTIQTLIIHKILEITTKELKRSVQIEPVLHHTEAAIARRRPRSIKTELTKSTSRRIVPEDRVGRMQEARTQVLIICLWAALGIRAI